MAEYPSHDMQKLGFTELVKTDLLAQHANENHRADRFIFHIVHI
jgi:hypothetical protein